MDDIRQLVIEIAHCSIAKKIRSGESPDSPCRKIVGLQTGSLFQLPEPWSGNIDSAPILFISSNPSIDEREQYPDEFWSDERLVNFFHNRFGSDPGWVRDLRASQKDGSWSRRPVAFWCHARARAAEILGKRRREIRPGIDFALTEVVHCKSRAELGVKEARQACSYRYLDRILSLSKAKALIVYGKHAKETVQLHFGSSLVAQTNGLSMVSVRETTLMLAFLPAPNERGSLKTLKANVGDDGISLLRAHLNARDFG